MSPYPRTRARSLSLLLCTLSLLMLSAVPVSAASPRPSATVRVCETADLLTLRMTITWQNFNANSFAPAFYEWAPRSTVGGEPVQLTSPGTSGTQDFQVTADPDEVTGPSPALLNSWDRGRAVLVYDDLGNFTFGPSDEQRRPHGGWATCA